MSTLPHAKVAVITRTKNRPVLLRRALASVAAQTFSDYVHVVVNDAGEHAPVDAEIAALDASAAERVHVIHRPESVGMEAASNDGIRKSSSDYLVVHDDDDSWDPSFLQQTVERLDAGANAVATRTEVVHESVDGDNVTIEGREILAPDKHDVTLCEVVRRNFVPPISLLYRRSLHDEVGLYDEDLPVLGDWDFNLRVLAASPIEFIDGPPLAFWHHRRAAEGALGNSVVAGGSTHERFDPLVRDKYLRAELAGGSKLGGMLLSAHLFGIAGADLARGREEALGVALHTDRKVADLDARVDDQHHRMTELVRRSVATETNRLVAQLDHLQQRVTELNQLVYSQTPRQRARSYARVAKRLARRALNR